METARALRKRLGLLLVEKGLLSAEELDAALAEQRSGGGLLGDILVRSGFTSRPAIQDALAEQSGVLFEPETGFGSGLREELARRHDERRRFGGGRSPTRATTESSHGQLAEVVALPQAAAPAEVPPAAPGQPTPTVNPTSGDPAGQSRDGADEEEAAPPRPADHAGEERKRRGVRARLERRLERYLARSAAELDDRGEELEQRRKALEEGEEALAAREQQAIERRQRVEQLELPPESDRLIDELLKRLNDWEALVAKLRRELSSLQQEAGKAKDEVRARDERLQRARESEDQLRSEVTRLQEEQRRDRGIRQEGETALAAARGELERATSRIGELEARRADADRRVEEARAELESLREAREETAAERKARVGELERLLEDERTRRAELESRVGELERGADGEGQAPAGEDRPIRHLLFFRAEGGYDLASMDGPPPGIGDQVTPPGAPGRFVVLKVGRSPLPGDPSPCAFLEAMTGSSGSNAG